MEEKREREMEREREREIAELEQSHQTIILRVAVQNVRELKAGVNFLRDRTVEIPSSGAIRSKIKAGCAFYQ